MPRRKNGKDISHGIDAVVKEEIQRVTESAAPPKEIEYVGSLEVPTFYANNAGLKATFWDLRIDWGLILESDDKKTKVQPAAATIMGWAHAKILSQLLTNVVSTYETRFGAIVMPKGKISTKV